MAVFTAIAGSIVGAIATAGTIAGSVTLFNIAVGVVATGLGAATAKLLGVFDPPDANGRDPGVKIQLPPGTDNKVPRMYGRNYTGGIITDAEIKNSNKTMAYCIVISEYNDNDVWTVNDIYRGDSKLVFQPAQPHILARFDDPNSTSTTRVDGKMRVRVYAGGSEASNQIFPSTGTAQAAYSVFNNWTSANTMEDLVFAIVELDYEPEEQLTGLGAITFDLSNSLNDPANVLLDYLTNDRYGAGLSSDQVDSVSLTALAGYANQQVDYLDASNTTQQHNRYQVDGALSMFDTAKANINKICQAAGCWFTFNNKTGQFGVVVNRQATQAEKDAAYEFTDHNIVSSLAITSTELFSLYNGLEVEYASVNQRDQTDVYYAEVGAAIRNPNEPDNVLNYRLDMVNDKTRVAQLANIDLNQSRISTVVELSADFSSMVIDVGDVVKLTSALYGFNETLFRVMRTEEQEDADGAITMKFALLQYDDDVYGDIITQEDLPVLDSGVSNWWAINGMTTPQVGNVVVVDDPTGTTANVHSPSSGAVIGTLPIADARDDYGSVFSDDSVFIAIPITPSIGTTFNLAKVVLINESSNTVAPVVYTQAPTTSVDSGSYFTDAQPFIFVIDTYDFSANTQFRMEISMEDTFTGVASLKYITGTFGINPQNMVDPGTDIPDGTIGEVKLDTPLQDKLNNTAANLNVLDGDLANLELDLANLDTELTALTSNVNTLETVTIPNLNADLANAENDINTLETVTLPALQGDLDDAENAITTLNTVTIPGLDSNISDTQNAITTLNTVTLPDLQSNLDALDTELTNSFPITTTQITDGAITTAKIAANQVTALQIAAGTITAQQIQAGTITAAEIATGTITADKIDANVFNAITINANSITTRELATDAVRANNILAGQITASKIATNAITATKIQTGAVTAAKITSGAITTDKIGANQVTANEIATGTITATQIQAGSITGDRLAANTITANQIGANQITANELGVGELITSSAQVGDAVILEASIGDAQVSTLKIQDQAVTIPQSVSGTLNGTTAGSAGQTVTTLSFSWTGEAPSAITIQGSVSARGIADNQYAYATLTTNKGSIDIQEVQIAMFEAAQTYTLPVFAEITGALTSPVTVTLRARKAVGSAAPIYEYNLTGLGTKK